MEEFDDLVESDQEKLGRQLATHPLLRELLNKLFKFNRKVIESEQFRIRSRIASSLLHLSNRLFFRGYIHILQFHDIEAMSLFRSALETAAYSYTLGKNHNLIPIYLKRNKDPKAFNKAFRDGGIKKKLFSKHPVLESLYDEYYDKFSIYAAHPNPEVLTALVEIIEQPDGLQPRYHWYIKTIEQNPKSFVRIFVLGFFLQLRTLEIFFEFLPSEFMQEEWESIVENFQTAMQEYGFIKNLNA